MLLLVQPHISLILRTETQCGGNQKTDYASLPPLSVLALSFLLIERPPMLFTPPPLPTSQPLETRTFQRVKKIKTQQRRLGSNPAFEHANDTS